MSASSKIIGPAVGGIIGIVIFGLAFLWFRSTYSIKGTIQVDTGIEIRQARQTDVSLIQGFVSEDLDQLVAEYNSFKNRQTDKMVEQLVLKSKEISDSKKPKTEIENKEEIVEKALATDPDEAEKETIDQRIREYAKNAVYCRKSIPDIRKGKYYYESGAEFWEEKISNLKDYERVVVDEASLNYETTWEPTGGLGKEPIQIVKAVVRTNLTGAIEQEPAEEPAKEKPEEKVRDEVVPGSYLTKDDVMSLAVELNKELRSEYNDVAGKSSDLILTMTIEQTKTDDKGNFVFKDKVVQPGKFIIFSKFDVLSAEGEPVEFMWFHPVNVSIKRLALDKTTVVNLDELNMSKPPYLDIHIPEKEEVYLELVDKLTAKLKEPEKENADASNIIDELLMTE